MMKDRMLQSNQIPLDIESLSLAELCELVRTLHGQNAELHDQITTLHARIAELEAQLNQHSGNSSKPPSMHYRSYQR